MSSLWEIIMNKKLMKLTGYSQNNALIKKASVNHTDPMSIVIHQNFRIGLIIFAVMLIILKLIILIG
jgi:hypothetical protein